jgi:hypothetical protein
MPGQHGIPVTSLIAGLPWGILGNQYVLCDAIYFIRTDVGLSRLVFDVVSGRGLYLMPDRNQLPWAHEVL